MKIRKLSSLLFSLLSQFFPVLYKRQLLLPFLRFLEESGKEIWKISNAIAYSLYDKQWLRMGVGGSSPPWQLIVYNFQW